MFRILFLTCLILALLLTFSFAVQRLSGKKQLPGVLPGVPANSKTAAWQVPDTSLIPDNDSGNAIRYGRALVVNTSFYLGPNGKVKAISNGLDCQNCHLDAGTKFWGNNFGAVASLYPKFMDRSGTIESIEKKINDCFQRSMNGKALDSVSKEMRAMVAYMKWLGSTVKPGTRPAGSGLKKLPFLATAADPVQGKKIFISRCMSCHGRDGQGKKGAGDRTYVYPPLWGSHSYNTGAGIYRLSKFAAFVKNNMPVGISHDKPLLSDEEAWNVAAYVNSRPRPQKDISKDWPDIKSKPVDNPFGPFADTFPHQQHKFGPFGSMESASAK